MAHSNQDVTCKNEQCGKVILTWFTIRDAKGKVVGVWARTSDGLFVTSIVGRCACNTPFVWTSADVTLDRLLKESKADG